MPRVHKGPYPCAVCGDNSYMNLGSWIKPENRKFVLCLSCYFQRDVLAGREKQTAKYKEMAYEHLEKLKNWIKENA